MATLGRLLEGPVSRLVYGRRAIAAVSASTREELRRRLKFPGPIFIVPNGTSEIPQWIGPRDPDPTIAVVTRLVAHKRLDVLLHHLVQANKQITGLHVDVIGDGPELGRLTELARRLGIERVVTFHGRQSDVVRDSSLRRAWLTTSTSAGEGWSCSIIEAAAWGAPCLALRVPGVRDSVIHGRTGWLIGHPEHFGQALVRVIHQLADEAVAQQMAASCQAWARCFTWERSAELLAGVVAHQIDASHAQAHGVPPQRQARPDITTLIRTAIPSAQLRRWLRATDEIRTAGGQTSVLLGGCDELDAIGVLDRIGITYAELRLADRYDLLAGPQGLPLLLTSPLPPQRTDPA
jgi:hypothetical protein